MDDMYHYPVFFECHNLPGEQIKKIERYFQIHRRSGGGDCRPLRRVNDQVYSVAFKSEKDQQAVLQRYEHVVKLADGCLSFTVRGSLDPPSSAITTSTASHDFTAPVQSPQSIPASTPSTSGGNYELQLDPYLLRYLKESPKAGKQLEKELSSVACSAKLYPEAGMALVRCLAQPGAEDEVRNWKAEVDKVFDGYLCHYEVDPHKVKALLQSCSSHQITDEVKVYSEVGVAVVVGERSQVSARLVDAEHSRVKGSRLSEKQTSIHRLGTAKLRLLWKDIELSLGRDFPGVKVTQGDVGQLVLEGSVEEILKAGDWISDMENLLSERTVSDMSPHFLAFLKRAYGGPGGLGDFLGVGDKVEVELRDTELRLFSRSAEELDETEKKLQEKFKEVKICVPNCSAVPSELQEQLKSKKNEMNQGQHRAQVVFGSESTVFLLGHTKEVEELSEAVTQFILDQSSAQNIVDLPFPELAQVLPELLQLYGFEYSGVTLQTLTSSSRPVVMLEGPSSKVTEVKSRLGPFLDSLIQDKVITDSLGAVRNFRTSTGKTCDRLLQGISTGNQPSDVGFQIDTAQNTARGATAGAPGDGVCVEIIQGTIETQQVDALVSPMVGHDPLSTRVGNTLFKMVGSQLTARFRKEAEEEMMPGDTVLVEALPGLPSNAVFFLSLVPWDDDEDGPAVQVLRLCISTILTSCENRGFGSVAFPVVGAGIVLRFPDDVVARVLLEEVHDFEQNRARRTPFMVRIVIHPNDVESVEVFKSVQETLRFTKAVHQRDHVSTTKRIILLGKTGSGKSNLANTIFGEELFSTNDTPNSGTRTCQSETKSVNGRSVTLIDTPGFFDAERSEEDMKPEIVSCITECAPGPHAFLIVLKVEKFTVQEQAVIKKICEYFSEDALKYAVIVFTHGDQLRKGTKIEEFVSQNKNLSDLVKKCGGRCHVIDNKYWKHKQQNNYRSNQFQVEDLLNTINKMVMENNGGYYTNTMLETVEKEIQKQEVNIRQSSGNLPVEEIRQQAKTIVSERFLIQMAGTATGAVLGAFFGLAAMVGLVVTALNNFKGLMTLLKRFPAVGGPAVAAAGGVEAAGLTAAGVVVGVTTVGLAATGGVMGGMIGHNAAEGAKTPMEAAQRAVNAVMEKGKATIKLN